MLFNDRRANKRALKKAQGPSLAPRGYNPGSRTLIHSTAAEETGTRKQRYAKASARFDECQICGENHG